MSWLKETLKAKTNRDEERQRLATIKNNERLRKIKEDWKQVVTPAYQAIGYWNRLGLSKIIDDVVESGLVVSGDSSSALICLFLAREGNPIRDHRFEVKGRYLASIEEVLEANKSTWNHHYPGKYTPEELSFQHVEQCICHTVQSSQGDRDYFSYPVVFSLKVTGAEIVADSTRLGSLADFRSRRDVERRLDSYLATTY